MFYIMIDASVICFIETYPIIRELHISSLLDQMSILIVMCLCTVKTQYMHECVSQIFQNAKEPKATINLSELNVCLAPSKMNQENGLQLSYMCEGSTRHIYVYHESGETIIHWYTAIRSIKLNWLMVAYPSASAEEASIIILLFIFVF